jgi:hypothetical protein
MRRAQFLAASTIGVATVRVAAAAPAVPLALRAVTFAAAWPVRASEVVPGDGTAFLIGLAQNVDTQLVSHVDLDGVTGAAPTIRAREVGASVIGDSDPTVGASLHFPRQRLTAFGLGRHRIELHFDYRDPSGSWIEFGSHIVTLYVMPDLPSNPWSKTVAAIAPWQTALDVIVAWAPGLTNIDVVMAKLTQQLHLKGRGVFRYDETGSYVEPWGYRAYENAYYLGQYHFSAFLERLAGGPGRGEQVDCYDCAYALWLLGALAGALVTPARFVALGPDKPFHMSPVGVIGSAPGVVVAKIFSAHVVVQRGYDSFQPSTHVWDACLSFDEAPLPTMPTDLAYGGPGGYAARMLLYPDEIELDPNAPIAPFIRPEVRSEGGSWTFTAH